jgi:ABC-type antimicrobial peptide transport system ATPase subunit
LPVRSIPTLDIRADLSKSTAKVFTIIDSKWPINAVEVADILGDSGSAKSLSAKYLYHFKKLKDNGMIVMKRVGNTYIVWPSEVEVLRMKQ